MLMLTLWFLSYFVGVDSERHRNLLFETSEFSLILNNLPTLDDNYTLEQMKAELWDHIATIVKEQPQQISRLRNSEESRACEIIDIQFAMSDYQYLEDVVKIKKLSQEIEKIDMKMEECGDSSRAKQKFQQTSA